MKTPTDTHNAPHERPQAPQPRRYVLTREGGAISQPMTWGDLLLTVSWWRRTDRRRPPGLAVRAVGGPR